VEHLADHPTVPDVPALTVAPEELPMLPGDYPDNTAQSRLISSVESPLESARFRATGREILRA